MADLGTPDRFSVAIRILLWIVFAFIFALVGWEKFWDGQVVAATVNAVLLIAVTIIVVKWNQFAERWRRLVGIAGRRKVTMFYIGLAVICALGLGVSIGKLMGGVGGPSTIIAPSSTDTGRIVWNLDEAARGLSFFLGFNRQNQEEIRVSGFAAHGRNTSNDPITQFKGYVRSDITNEQLPIYLNAQDPNAPNVFGSIIPTLPEETFGIPGLAEFTITTFNKPIFEGGKDGIPISKFMRDFAAFTVVLEYDGTIVQRHFTKEEIQGQLDLFERQIDPRKANTPRITRRPNATPPIQPSLPFLPAPPAQDQQEH